MCGRSRSTLAPAQVLRAAGAQRWVDRDAYQPSYNVTPGAATPVARLGADGAVEVVNMRWGLVPSFTKPGDRPDFWRMFNARSETVAEKPVFSRLVASRRCLVLLNGFYEWKQEKFGKQPFYIFLSPSQEQQAQQGGRGEGEAAAAGGSLQGGQDAEEEPLVMAGLWDVWDGPEGPLHSYTILTTDSSKRLEWLHDRMPVILRTREQQQLWLNFGEKAAGLQALFAPYSGEDLRWYPVTPQMSKPAFQGPECCRELKKPSIAAFFKPRAAPAASPSGPAAAASAPPPAGPGDDEAKEEPRASRSEQQQQLLQAGSMPEAVNADERPPAEPSPGLQQQQQQPATGAAAPAQQKRKTPGGAPGSSSKASGSGSAKKKNKGERPHGQPDLRLFFGKK